MKTRFAPSPTGFLHVGSLRTALFGFLLAKKLKGKFVLRIEDTDQSREVEGAAEGIQTILKEFDLLWDEGPYFQSQRKDIYQEYAKELVDKGAAYEEEGAIRQTVPKEGTTSFEDGVYGKIEVENIKLDQGVLLKSDGFPTYNFANVVDDHEMGITHVMRGEEFIPSTPKHILLYQSFGWEPPKFIHLPLILDQKRKKFSKRTHDVAVEDYLKKGFLKEALLNFIALLGWNPKTEQEIFSLEELIPQFSVEKINRAGAIFDLEKLDFINREWEKRLNFHITVQDAVAMSDEVMAKVQQDPLYLRFKELVLAKFPEKRDLLLVNVWPLVMERIKGPSDLEERLPEFDFFFKDVDYEAELLKWKDASSSDIKQNLEKLLELLRAKIVSVKSVKELEDLVIGYLKEQGIGNGEALWPLRVALSGQKNSPGPFEIIIVLSRVSGGLDTVYDRINLALEKLAKM